MMMLRVNLLLRYGKYKKIVYLRISYYCVTTTKLNIKWKHSSVIKISEKKRIENLRDQQRD